MSEVYGRLAPSARDGMKTDSSSVADVKSSWNDQIRKDESTSGGFILFIYEDDSKRYRLLGSGSGGYDEMKDLIVEDQIVYAGIRVLVGSTPKFLQLLYIGTKVSVVKRGKAQLLKSAPFNAMEGAHGEIPYPVGESLDKDRLLSLIQTNLKTKESVEF